MGNDQVFSCRWRGHHSQGGEAIWIITSSQLQQLLQDKERVKERRNYNQQKEMQKLSSYPNKIKLGILERGGCFDKTCLYQNKEYGKVDRLYYFCVVITFVPPAQYLWGMTRSSPAGGEAITVRGVRPSGSLPPLNYSNYCKTKRGSKKEEITINRKKCKSYLHNAYFNRAVGPWSSFL